MWSVAAQAGSRAEESCVLLVDGEHRRLPAADGEEDHQAGEGDDGDDGDDLSPFHRCRL